MSANNPHTVVDHYPLLVKLIYTKQLHDSHDWHKHYIRAYQCNPDYKAINGRNYTEC